MSSRPSAPPLSTAGIIAFDVLMFTGLAISIVALIPPIFAKGVVRTKTWFTLLACNILYCVVHLMLLGRQTGARPDKVLCMAQGGLIYAAPPTLALAALAFVSEIYIRLSSIVHGHRVQERYIWLMIWAVTILPTLIFWVDSLLAFAYPFTVKRNWSGAFCHIDQNAPTIIASVLTAFFIVGMLCVNVLIVVLIFRRRPSGSLRERMHSSAVPGYAFLRIIIVATIGLVSTLVVQAINWRPNPNVYISLGVVPVALALVFALQKDILYFYMCKRRSSQSDSVRNSGASQPLTA